MRETVITISDVFKEYRLGTIGGGTLRGDLQSWWAKIRKKEDPNLPIEQKQYLKNEKFMALNGISLCIQKGETVGIIGANGAGKSTLLKLMSRVTAPTKGSITIQGRISSMLEVGTGFHPELTGRENIYLNGAILGMTRKEVGEKIEDIIEFSECREFIDTPVKRYSSGMYVKLAFSVAAHLDSDILLMDEVLAVGDMSFQKKCIDKMLEITNQEGKTILYVSHNMDTVRRLCKRCVVLKQGSIIYDGATETGIDIYMGSRRVPADFLNDYSDKSKIQRFQFLTNKVHLDSLEILDKVEIHKNNLPIAVKWHTLESTDMLSMRCIFHDELNQPIATAICQDFIVSKSGEHHITKFCIPITKLPPATYKVLMIFYEHDIFGNVFDADAVWPAFVFQTGTKLPIQWRKQQMGGVILDDISIL